MFRSLLLIVALYVALTLIYVFAMPPGEAPDEPAHFLYAQHMIDTGTPPTQPPPQRASFWKNGFVTTAYEWYQPPLYYWLGASFLSTVRSLSPMARYGPFPGINPEFPGPNRPLFVPEPFRFTELHLLRFLSLVFGLGTIVATFLLAHFLLPNEDWLPELAAGFVAFIPQFTFLHAYITNDSLAIAGSSLGLAALIYAARAEPAQHYRAWLMAGCVVSIALATKMTTWYLLPLGLLLAAANLLTRQRNAWESGMDILTFVGVASIAPILSWLVWPDLLHRLIGSPHSQGIDPTHLSLTYFNSIFPMTHTSFWGMFGWVNLPIREPSILLLDIIGIVGLVAATFFLIRHWSAMKIGQQYGLLLLLAGVVAVATLFVAFNLVTLQPQGRYFYPVIAAIGFFVAYGWIQIAGQHRRIATFLVLGTMFFVNLFNVVTVLLPTYRFLAG